MHSSNRCPAERMLQRSGEPNLKLRAITSECCADNSRNAARHHLGIPRAIKSEHRARSPRNPHNRIALPLGLTEAVMVPLVRHIVDVRNICAHHGRLWNRGFLICPRLSSKPRDLQLSLDHSAVKPPAKLFNALTLIAHVVRTVAPDSTWAAEIKAHVLTHPTGDFAAMGFPDDWQERPLWA